MKYVLNLLFLLFDFVNSRITLLLSGLTSQTITYAISKGRKRKLDLYLPKASTKDSPLIIQLHGGGWKTGSRRMIQPAILRQIKRGYAVASVSYSFSYQAKWPTQAHEIKAAIRYLRTHAQEFGIDPDSFFVWGISAGAHIGSVVGSTSGTTHLEGELGYTDCSSKVQGVISWYGPSDFRQDRDLGLYDRFFRMAASDLIGVSIHKNPQKAQQANPIHFIHPQTPPFYLMHGTNDRIVNINHSILLFEALQKEGIPAYYLSVPGYFHADTRFNLPKHIKGIEDFLDAIAFAQN